MQKPIKVTPAKQLIALVDFQQYLEIVKEAQQQEITLSAMVRLIIADYLKGKEGKKLAA